MTLPRAGRHPGDILPTESQSCAACLLQKRGLELRPECQSCTGDPVAGIASLAPREILYLEGDRGTALYGVLQGILRETRSSEDGRMIGLRVIQPGDLVGTEALLGEPYQCSVEALTPARLCRAQATELESVLASRPGQGLAFGKALVKEAETLRDAITMLGAMSAEERIVAALRQLTRGVPQGTWVRLPLSRQALAELLGLALGTVSRTIQRLDREGVLEVRGRSVRFCATPQSA